MTTQEKAVVIQKIVANHEDNRIAVRAVDFGPGLEELVVAAMNEAFKADLVKVFALAPPASRRRG